MIMALVAWIRRVTVMMAFALAFVSASSIYAAPRTAIGMSHDHFANSALLAEDEPTVAVDAVLKTIERAVDDVAFALAGSSGEEDSTTNQDDADWQRFSAGNAEIWLPAGFIGGDLEQDLDLIIERLRALGPGYAEMVEMITQNPSAFRLIAFDPEHLDSGVLTNVNIATEKVLSFMTTETYLDIVEGMLPAQFEVREREQIELANYEDASQLIVYAKLPGAPPMMQILYVIKDSDNNVWAVNFSTHESTFDSWLPIFRRSIESFSVSPD